MKKFLYIATMLAAVATATTSCKSEVDDLFDTSAAERTQQAMTLLREISKQRQVILFTCKEV